MGSISGKHTAFGFYHDSVKFILENFIVIVKVFCKTFLYDSNVLKFSSNQANLSFFGGKILSGKQITFPFIFSSRLSQHEAQVEKIWTLNSFQKTPELLRWKYTAVQPSKRL